MAAAAHRPAPLPKTRRAAAPARLVAVARPANSPTVVPTQPTLAVGTPAAAASRVPASWAGVLPALAGGAVVVTLIGLGFSVRRGLARVD